MRIIKRIIKKWKPKVKRLKEPLIPTMDKIMNYKEYIKHE